MARRCRWAGSLPGRGRAPPPPRPRLPGGEAHLRRRCCCCCCWGQEEEEAPLLTVQRLGVAQRRCWRNPWSPGCRSASLAAARKRAEWPGHGPAARRRRWWRGRRGASWGWWVLRQLLHQSHRNQALSRQRMRDRWNGNGHWCRSHSHACSALPSSWRRLP